MLGKFAAAFRPILMGIITKITNSNRLGILSIIFLFIVDGILLSNVNIKNSEDLSK